ncbi:MAG: SCO family protein [Paracoccaceae bacterium]
MRAVVLTFCVAQAGAPVLAEDFSDGRFHPPKIALTDQAHQPRDLRDVFAAGPVVMTFAYTTCETICPLGNAVMAEIDSLAAADVTLVTVTIDPDTDTPARMARAAREMAASPRWLWLTGDSVDIRRLLDAVDAPKGPIELHDPIFVVADPDRRTYRRSLSLPDVSEILALLAGG